MHQKVLTINTMTVDQDKITEVIGKRLKEGWRVSHMVGVQTLIIIVLEQPVDSPAVVAPVAPAVSESDGGETPEG